MFPSVRRWQREGQREGAPKGAPSFFACQSERADDRLQGMSDQQKAAHKGLWIEYVPLSELDGLRAKRNPKGHDKAVIGGSIAAFGFAAPPLINERDGNLVAGHGRIDALLERKASGAAPPKNVTLRRKDGEWLVPLVRGNSFATEAEAEAFLMVDNSSTILGGWDAAGGLAVLADLKTALPDLSGLLKFDLLQLDLEGALQALKDGAGDPGPKPPRPPALSDRFLVPPFSVLNARDGVWQDRKRQWLALGIQSEVGRGDNLLKFSETAKLKPSKRFASDQHKLDALMRKKGAPRPNGSSTEPAQAFGEKYAGGDAWRSGAAQPGEAAAESSGTSIFDPVICELAYRWFCPLGGSVLDPFSGGSVRGIVASMLGRSYTGIDLRPEQIEANEAQAARICAEESRPRWIVADSRTLPTLDVAPADFVFSCPPYGDLERYSDDPLDLSVMDHADFVSSYREIIAAAVARLKPDRFACFVVGDYRDKRGLYRNFVSETIAAFSAAGASLYNEAILVTAVGSLPIRAGKIFAATRKLGKTHQNVLVFVKGDPRAATEACGIVDVSGVPELQEEGGDAREPERGSAEPPGAGSKYGEEMA